jgi:hypothetical protein
LFNIFQIKQIWFPLFRLNFLKSALNRAHECHKGFYLYQQNVETEVSLISVTFIIALLNVSLNAVKL